MPIDSTNTKSAVAEKAPRFTITRARDAVLHTGRKQRGADQPGFVLHPAIERGMQLVRDTSDAGGATVYTLFSAPMLHVSYAWFKSGFPLPIHSHDTECYYQIIAGSMNVGTEVLSKGDGVFIPAGVPYTLTPGLEGVEFLEIRTSPDYDTHYRAKNNTYWDRIAATRRARKPIWATEKPPYGLVAAPPVAQG